MSIAFRCDQCGKHYAAGDHLAGQKFPCKKCGRTLRIPGTPKALPANRKRRRDPEPAAVTPPALDLYGLEEEPAPEALKGAIGPFADADEAASIVPRPGAPSRPRTKQEQKAWEKRIKARDRERPSYARPAFGLTLGGALIASLFLWRMYSRLTRSHAAVDEPPAAARESDEDVEGAPPPVVRPEGGDADADPNAKASPAALPSFPDPGPGVEIEPGVRFVSVAMGPRPPGRDVPPGHGMRLWLYLPAGDHASSSLPCVLIAPAGSNLITGNELDEGRGDHPEHLPYVRAGFAVLAYGLDGELRNASNPGDADLRQAAETFLAARAGLTNADLALQWLIAKVPQVDPARLYAAGHSSAGTMALLLAEHDPRIRACVAFAPRVDISRHFTEPRARDLRRVVPRLDEFFTTYNPRQHEARLHCPLFLFHARDDSVVPVRESEECAERLKGLGKSVTLEVVPSGDHHDAMIHSGIPRAIAWLKSLGARR